MPGILFVVAMEAEAGPVRGALGLHGEGTLLHPAFPAVGWRDGNVAVATNGKDPRFGVASIATQPAVTTTLHAIEQFSPSLVISAGTAGGFSARGGEIGSIYLADRCVYHDRRVSIPGFDRYGDGDFPVANLTTVAETLGLPQGTVTTGNALDAPPVDMEKMTGSAAVAKDMEAAAVAWVCERLEVPFTALKVITDLVDEPEATADQFSRNLKTATIRLAKVVPQLVDALEATR